MDKGKVIAATVEFVKAELSDAEKGHDWWHIERVWNNAKNILETESADGFVVELGALLHDIRDHKFHGDEEDGPRVAREFLSSHQVDEADIVHVENIIRHISWKSNIGGQKWTSPELAIVQDADRLDAVGAIGIARCFTYGGFKNRLLHDPTRPANMALDEAAFKNHDGTTINHFYEKLLLLKDRMNTKTGKELAEGRHRYMEGYLEQFFAEWKGGK